eukprot:6183986-Pleurochrysis_carterae.AAC.2
MSGDSPSRERAQSALLRMHHQHHCLNYQNALVGALLMRLCYTATYLALGEKAWHTCIVTIVAFAVMWRNTRRLPVMGAMA